MGDGEGSFSATPDCHQGACTTEGADGGNSSVGTSAYRLPSPAVRRSKRLEGRNMTLYESDSDAEDELVHQMDLETVLPEIHLGDTRKRASATSEEPVSAKVSSTHRGGLVRRTASRSRPSATARGRGFVNRDAVGDASAVDSDEGLGRRLYYSDIEGSQRGTGGEGPQIPMPETRETLATAALLNVAKIQDQIRRCGHIKGGVWGAINDASKAVIEAVEALRTITPGEEYRRLRMDNSRLAGELDVVRAELRAFKKAYEDSRSSAEKAARPAIADLKEAFEEMQHDLHVSLGGMINARLGELEARLPPEPVLRPPLAADRRQEPPARPRTQPNLAAGAMREPEQPKAVAGPSAGRKPKTTVPSSQPRQGKVATGQTKKGQKGPTNQNTGAARTDSWPQLA